MAIAKDILINPAAGRLHRAPRVEALSLMILNQVAVRSWDD
jgi:hypothetical protein